MYELDRIFDGEDMVRVSKIDVVEHGRQGGRLTRPGRPGYQHESLSQLGKRLDAGGKTKLLHGWDFGGNGSQDRSHPSTGQKYVNTKITNPRNRLALVQILVLF